METSQALIEAIRDFPGGVVLVSHDQHLLTSVCKNLYVVENGELVVLRGGGGGGDTNADAFNDYKKAVIAGKR
jgi:ATP-binding cassette, subfamily F, member 3